MNDQNGNDNNDNNNFDPDAMLRVLADVIDRLDAAIAGTDIKAGEQGEQGEQHSGTLVIEATDAEGEIKDRTVERMTQGHRGVPMKMLTKLLLGVSPELAMPLASLLVPRREDIVALMIGQQKAEGIVMVTVQIHHDEDCSCPPGLNFITLMHHPRYKDSTGEQFTHMLIIGQYEHVGEAIAGHEAWQEKLATMTLSKLPDVIEGTYDPVKNERVMIYRHDVPTTIQ